MLGTRAAGVPAVPQTVPPSAPRSGGLYVAKQMTSKRPSVPRPVSRCAQAPYTYTARGELPRKLACVIECPPDFARTADDYARHRAGFPPELLDRLVARGIARPGARVVDLGTGTGGLARLFARHGCEVTGVDNAAPLLEHVWAVTAWAAPQ